MTTMREDIISDLETVFEDWDDITWNATSFKGIFHNSSQILDALGIGVESRNPFIQVEDADISGMAKGDAVTVNSVAYYCLDIRPTGFGKSIVILSKD
jgi:hypothetical protein